MLKRLPLLLLAAALIAAPIAESIAAEGAPVAGAAKKKGKKCKKKGKKKGKKAKCKKRTVGGGGSQGLPGKPVSPNTPTQPEPLVLASLELTENPLLGGTSGPGRVTLSAAAPAGGQPVTLGSADPTRATVPDSVHIAAGQTSATFPVSTTVGEPTTVTLTAAIEGSVRNADLEIVDEASLESVELDYQCYPDDDLTNFGANLVSLNVRAPDNTVVDLDSSDPFSLEVPPTVTVPQNSFTGIFTVDTLQVSPSVTVTASYDGIDRTDTASVRNEASPNPVASSLALVPASVVVGNSSTGRVSLDCEAGPGGVTVALSTSYAGVTVPASVTVPEGQLSANFSIATSINATPGNAPITATAGASVQSSLTLRAIGT